MPIYEYACLDCRHEFEALVRASEEPACPACRSRRLERLRSTFAVTTEGGSQAAFRKARRAKQAQTREQEFYEHRDHDDEH